MGYKIVDITENDTGQALVSEMLSIPLLMRGESNTRLLKGTIFKVNLSTRRSISERLGLPLLVKSSAGRASLMKGTISSRLGLTELFSKKK
jgi:hypothetical protein